MKAAELKKWIESLTQDIDFEYFGVLGSVCPLNRNYISLCYGETEIVVKSVDDAMETPFIKGYSLAEICEKLIL